MIPRPYAHLIVSEESSVLKNEKPLKGPPLVAVPTFQYYPPVSNVSPRP